MGTHIETNDTLQITSNQGFPVELDLEKHLINPLLAENLKGKVFEFLNKPGIRVYHVPPVRNFLVENRDGKWIYWGLIYILETSHNYLQKTTSGKFNIIYLYNPDEMKKAHELTDRNNQTQFFK